MVLERLTSERSGRHAGRGRGRVGEVLTYVLVALALAVPSTASSASRPSQPAALAAAPAAPPTAGADRRAASALTDAVGFALASPEAARGTVREVEQELERELTRPGPFDWAGGSGRAIPSAGAQHVARSPLVTATAAVGLAAVPLPAEADDVLAKAKGFYERLARDAPPVWGPRLAARNVGARHALPLLTAAGPLTAPRIDGRAPLSLASSVLLARAESYRGVPYVWGGASGDGLDCSGLVARTALDLGRRLPHSAADLYRLGEPVPEDDLRPGDLVFFKDTYKPGISHVGIFEGGTSFLAASSRAGKVTSGDLARPYYRQKYAGARRLSLGDRMVAGARRWLGSAARALTAPLRLGGPGCL